MEVLVCILVEESIETTGPKCKHCLLMFESRGYALIENCDTARSHSVCQEEQMHREKTYMNLIMAYQSIKLFSESWRVYVEHTFSH